MDVEQTSLFVTVVTTPKIVKALKWVNRVVSKDPLKPALQVLYIQGEKVYASDGFRIHQVTIKNNPFPEGTYELVGTLRGSIAILKHAPVENNLTMDAIESIMKFDGMKYEKAARQIDPNGNEKTFAVFAAKPKFIRDALALDIGDDDYRRSAAWTIGSRLHINVYRSEEINAMAVVMPMLAEYGDRSGGTRMMDSPYELPAYE